MSKATILVVDDEALIRWSLAERLKAEGFDVLEAETGRSALEKLPQGVDLVLLDFRLPDTDGVSVLRKIKEFEGQGPVLRSCRVSLTTADLPIKQANRLPQDSVGLG